MIVNTDKFIERMCGKWSGRRQPVSDPLKNAWRILCEHLNDHAEGKNKSKWSVIPLPTGVGKTEGVISYCAELSIDEPSKGVLIITRFTDEADRIVRGINSEAKRIVALTQHSNQKEEDKPNLDEVYKSQVLVITHSAYKKALALEALNKTNALRNKYSTWLHGDRFIIIDEVLRIDEQIIVDYDEIRAARYSIPLHIERNFPKEIKYLDHLMNIFSLFTMGVAKVKYFSKADWVRNIDLEAQDIEPLLKALDEEEVTKTDNSYGKTVLKISKAYRKEVLDSLNDITHLQGFYTVSANKFLLTAMRMLMPDEIPNAVILDATARQNIIYELLGDFIKIVDVPDNVRDYSNVTLNILYGLPVGKKSLTVIDKDTLKTLYHNYCSHLPIPDTLYCVHKSNRDKFKNVVAGLNDDNLAHWGAIDGRDEWANFSNMFICGLPYMGQVNAENITLCFARWVENEGRAYHEDNITYYEEHDKSRGTITESFSMEEMPEDYWRDYERSHIAVSVIQAINRIRCRRVVDGKGGCANSNVYLCLGKKDGNQAEYQKYLISEIRKAMPNIMIKEASWQRSETGRLSAHEQLFIGILRSLKRGDHPAKEVIASAANNGISLTTVRRFQKAIVEDGKSEFTKQVAEMGCTYISKQGRYGKSIYRKT